MSIDRSRACQPCLWSGESGNTSNSRTRLLDTPIDLHTRTPKRDVDSGMIQDFGRLTKFSVGSGVLSLVIVSLTTTVTSVANCDKIIPGGG